MVFRHVWTCDLPNDICIQIFFGKLHILVDGLPFGASCVHAKFGRLQNNHCKECIKNYLLVLDQCCNNGVHVATYAQGDTVITDWPLVTTGCFTSAFTGSKWSPWNKNKENWNKTCWLDYKSITSRIWLITCDRVGSPA